MGLGRPGQAACSRLGWARFRVCHHERCYGTLGLAWGGLCERLGLLVVAGCPGAEELR